MWVQGTRDRAKWDEYQIRSTKWSRIIFTSNFVGLTVVHICTFWDRLGNLSQCPNLANLEPTASISRVGGGGGRVFGLLGAPAKFAFQIERAARGLCLTLGTVSPDGPSGRVTVETPSPILLFSAGSFLLWQRPGAVSWAGRGRAGAGLWDVYCCRSFPSPGARVSRGVCGFSIKREKHDPS